MLASVHDAGLQHVADKVDEALVFDALAQTGQDNVVRDGVEALHEVPLDDPGRTGTIGLCYVP